MHINLPVFFDPNSATEAMLVCDTMRFRASTGPVVLSSRIYARTVDLRILVMIRLRFTVW